MIKALTISQPYASLIASGEKLVENRTWETLYRGPLAIHAGKGTQYLTRQRLADYPTSCIIAIVDLVACFHIENWQGYEAGGRLPPQAIRIGLSLENVKQILEHQHTVGPWCWLLSDVRQIEPVPAIGKQGLWNWNAPAELAVAR